MNYKRLNIYIGWLIFIVASTVYLMTAEVTASLWDCGEFIATAYKLEVGHPPGAPLFMLIGRVFSLFAGSVTEVGYWVNVMSALSSSFTILFLFWSITLLGKKIAEKDGQVMTNGQKIAIIGSGFVGAMAYTFTESFWFSAVEGEVYAMASLFTAIIFWAALKWDEEMTLIKRGKLTTAVHPLRWMVLIMYLIGLAIGVHLLGLLVLPAIAYIVAYQIRSKNTLKLFIITGVIGVVVLVFIQNGVIPGSIALASKMEIFFRNSMGLPFGTGTVVFFLLLVAVLVFSLLYTRKKGYKIANTALLGLVMLLIGYGSFATIAIRSNANPPLDENNPENLVTLYAYLKREQYGTWPVAYGQYFNSKLASREGFEDRGESYDRRWVVRTNSGNAVISFKEKELGVNYIKNSGQKYQLDEEYFVTNTMTREGQIPVYLQNTIFPRMFDQGDARKINGYKSWSGYDPNRKVSRDLIGSDGRPLPTFGNNLTYFVQYQVGWMYWRYFMWNFSGRQNDIQGNGDVLRGNWVSGFNVVDNARLGAQDENAPYFTSHNPNNTKFYYIPLILGLIGLFFHFMKAPKDAIVVGVLFLLTGIAIIVYLNQKPFEPRERDYAYAASFYAFAIWIGLGVYGLFEAYRSFGKEEYKKLGISIGGLFLLCLIADMSSDNGMPATISALIIGGIGGAAMLLMTALKNIKFSGSGAAAVATLLGIVAPLLMGTQTWEGHDRSNRESTRDLAYNYLISCSPNSILFTNGDNDTFPLWNIQEVEGVRTDVRVANLSLMQTDWYSDQMKMRAYESAPLPIKFREDQILMGAGNTDYVMFIDENNYRNRIPAEKADEITQKKIEANPTVFKDALQRLRGGLLGAISSMTANNEKEEEILAKMSDELRNPLENPGIDDYKRINLFLRRIYSDTKSNLISVNDQLLNQLQNAANSWTDAWDYLPLDYAMEFVREDKNMIDLQRGRKIRFFPASGFVIKVNVDNAVKAGIISEKYADQAQDKIKFDFRKGGMFRSDVNGLSREEVMMLDILANFDWTRGIFFSSPGGSDVAKALYGRGLLGDLGQVFGLIPLKENALQEYAREKMYEDLMKKYRFGNLAGEGVLVDYYTRRHTSQARNSYISLASQYLTDYQNAEKNEGIDTLPSAKNEKGAKFYGDRIEQILRYSLDSLPISKVFDFGEPRGSNKRLSNGDQVYTDGVVPEYVRILYTINRDDFADSLAYEYFGQLNTMANYFQNSNAMIAYRNKEDFIAFAMNFLRTYAVVQSTSPESSAAELGNEIFQNLSQRIVPGIANDLKGEEISESIRGGRTVTRRMTDEANDFVELYKALLTENGFSTGEEENEGQ